MSNSFNYRIVFNSSRHYLYLLALCNGGASVLLLSSSLPWPLSAFLCLMLLATLIMAIHKPYPTGDYKELVHQGSGWQLIHTEGSERFDAHRILLHVGLFFLIQLTSQEKQTLLVVFCDQINKDDYRHLKIIEKIK